MKINKVVKFAGVIVLSAGILSACGTQSPTDTVNSFTSAYQKDDIKTAFTYVDGTFNKVMKSNDMDIKESDKVIQDILKAESTGFKVNSVKELSTKGDTAKVQVDITGKDFGSAATKAVGQVMPTAFATAFASSNKKESQQAIQQMMYRDIVDNLNAKDAPTIEKKVTIALKKNKDGKYLIEPDNNLAEVLLPNYDQLEKLFNAAPNAGSSKPDQWVQDQNNAANGKPAAPAAPDESTSVVKTLATNQAVNMSPIQVTLDDVSIKKAVSVPQDEIDRVNALGYQVTGNSFNYISIKYTAKNTSPNNIDFDGIKQVVVISGDHQEVLGTNTTNIVPNDPNSDGVFYGQVTKQGNEGFITMTDPSKITKIIVTVQGTMTDKTYQTQTNDTDLTFNVQ